MTASKPMASANGAIRSSGVVVASTSSMALGPEGGQALGGERGHQLAQAGHGPLPAAWTISWRHPLATRAAARTRPMASRFSPKRSFTAYNRLSPGRLRPGAITPSAPSAG